MAITHKLYGPVMKNSANGTLSNIGSTDSVEIYVKLMTSGHSFDQDNEYWNTIAANETTSATAGSTDYPDGGKILNGTSLAYASRITTLSATSETEFTAAGNVTAFYAVLTASSYLVSCVDFDGSEQSVAGKFAINWTDLKILTNTVSA